MCAFTTWKILPSPSGWVVRCHGQEAFESRHGDKVGAIREAKTLATQSPPSQVVVHDAEGSVTVAIHYNEAARGQNASDGRGRLDGVA